MNARSNHIKVWPHLSIVFLVFAALGGAAAALWMRHEPKAEALALPHAARVERVDGEVGLSRDLSAEDDETRWAELTPNTPLTAGDRVYARDGSTAALAFTGRNYARLDPDSSLDVLSLSDRRTQLALREGSAVFDIGALAPGEMFEVATPYGAVDFREPGLYALGYNDDGSAFVSVLSGLAQVVGLAGSGQVSKGEMLTLLGQTAAQVALSRLSPDYAGGLVDDYYGYRYPDDYDGRYGDYDAYLNDPDSYDPY
ncbi:MAG TPA: FecR family protein, partial [Pyrinomonadaceae bacterium]